MTKLVEVETEKSNWEFQRVLRFSVSYTEIQEHLITDTSRQFHEFVNIVIYVPKVTLHIRHTCTDGSFSLFRFGGFELSNGTESS